MQACMKKIVNGIPRRSQPCRGHISGAGWDSEVN
jgi:hypothetical protein